LDIGRIGAAADNGDFVGTANSQPASGCYAVAVSAADPGATRRQVCDTNGYAAYSSATGSVTTTRIDDVVPCASAAPEDRIADSAKSAQKKGKRLKLKAVFTIFPLEDLFVSGKSIAQKEPFNMRFADCYEIVFKQLE